MNKFNVFVVLSIIAVASMFAAPIVGTPVIFAQDNMSMPMDNSTMMMDNMTMGMDNSTMMMDNSTMQ